MASDKVVGQIFETYEYDKFKPLPGNRGVENDEGVKKSKLDTFLRLIQTGKYIPEMGTIKVNKSLQIIEGHHRFQALKLNKLPIRYEIIESATFNEATGREKLANVYTLNSVNTVWTAKDMYQSAVKSKAPLAVKIEELIQKGKGTFDFLDVLALLTNDESYFTGMRGSGADMRIFERKDLVEHAETSEFRSELAWFKEINEKFRISQYRKTGLRVTYMILHGAREIIDPKKFREATPRIPDNKLQNNVKTRNVAAWTRTLTEWYNAKARDNVRVINVAKHLSKYRSSKNPLVRKKPKDEVKASLV